MLVDRLNRTRVPKPGSCLVLLTIRQESFQNQAEPGFVLKGKEYLPPVTTVYGGSHIPIKLTCDGWSRRTT
jgi:hypothetical protein